MGSNPVQIRQLIKTGSKDNETTKCKEELFVLEKKKLRAFILILYAVKIKLLYNHFIVSRCHCTVFSGY